jgi:hypothetical protein
MTSQTHPQNRNDASASGPIRRLPMVIAIALVVAIQQTNSLAATVRTVALSGQAAPGTVGGVTYETFDHHYSGGTVLVSRGPVLNDAGQVAFRANISGTEVGPTNRVGVWSEGSGNLALVARTGSFAPGGGTFAEVFNPNTNRNLELFSPNLNEAGQTAFWGGLSNGNLGTWSEGSGSLDLVAREDTPAPGTPAGVSFWFAGLVQNFSFLFEVQPLWNNVGQTAFLGGLKGGETNSSNNTGIWSQGSGDLSLSLRAGDAAVGMPAGVNYEPVQLTFSLNDVGQSGIGSTIVGPGVDDTNFAAFYTGAPGHIALVERMGNHAPGTPSGVNFGWFFGSHGFNNAGQMAIEGPLAGNVDETNDEGLWTNVSGSLELVAREGSQAVGTPAGVNYGTFTNSGWPVLNDTGQIAFITEIAGEGVDDSNDEGIWSGLTGDLTLVARTGDPAPETPSGVNFSDLEYPALNSSGQIAFRGDLTGSGVDATNDKGLWATDRTGAVQLIARSGEELEVAPGDFRTLDDLNFSTASGNSDGRPSGFNNLGEMVFWASFTDGSEGVFLSNAVAQLPGDFNNNGAVDGNDLIQWQGDFGVNALSDADNDGDSDGADFLTWQRQLGGPSSMAANSPVPEPTTARWALTILAMAAVAQRWPAASRRRRKKLTAFRPALELATAGA